jgi:hypothetical protein
MTFKQWLTEYYADEDGYDHEYSGTLAGLEDAWNAGVEAARDRLANGNDLEYLTSDEFRNRFEAKEHSNGKS